MTGMHSEYLVLILTSDFGDKGWFLRSSLHNMSDTAPYPKGREIFVTKMKRAHQIDSGLMGDVSSYLKDLSSHV